MTYLTINTTMPGPSAPAFRFATLSVVCAGAHRVLAARAATVPLAILATLLSVSAMVQSAPASAQEVVQQTRNGPVTVQAPQPTAPTLQPPASNRPVPSQLELARLLWSTTAAVDHANTSGNYSVLRDISAQRFQMNFNPARLTEIFSGLRSLDINLSNALLVPPTYYEAPTMVSNDVFRVRGLFQLRPIAIGFDVYYQWEQGRWKLFGIDLQPQQMTESQPGSQP